MSEPAGGAAGTALDAFERDVLEAAVAAGVSPALAAALRAHVDGATVVRRDVEPDGVTTYVCVPADAPRAEPGELTLCARARVEGLDEDASVEVSVHNGWLDSLLVRTGGAPWPARARLVGLTPDG